MTKLNITGLKNKATNLGPGPNGTYAHIGARGGTEMVAEKINELVDPELMKKFNIIHSRVRDDMIDPNKKNILVLHDTWDDPESAHLSDPASRARFDKLVFVSHFQQSSYNIGLGVPYSDGTVLQNAITPIDLPQDKPEDKIRLIYHTTPHRGLELLVPAYEKMCEFFDDIHLDVFSSFKIYGWEARDQPYEELFNRIKEHPQMTYHGYQPNDMVREYLAQSHIFAYPCIWPETSCISVLEAMSARCQVVTSNLSALPETCANFAAMYSFEEDHNVHVNKFANVLYGEIANYRANKLIQSRLDFQKMYIDNFYAWEYRGAQWNAFLRGLASDG